ncbi:MAG TPA: hypothetical protein VK590_03165, partial [Saprospiraceae bacterium]|nr:hypothetical protein [Saprospiraceae bacterium]
FILAMFLPRLVTQGMFPDGLLYSSIARNLAIGKGSSWQPFFSHGYWLDFVKPIYYENLPLMLIVESFFFRLFGEYWWVEKLFSFVVLGINLSLLIHIWNILSKTFVVLSGFAFLPLILWYLMPTVIWGNPNNLMDSFQLIFCLLATGILIRSAFQEDKFSWLFAFLGGLVIFIGVLAKGPVGFFPVVIPFLIYLLFKQKHTWRGFFLSAVSFLTALLSIILLCYYNPSAYDFIKEYWFQRLNPVLNGTRSDADLRGLYHLKVLYLILIEISPLIGLIVIIVLYRYFKKSIKYLEEENRKLGILFLLIGLSATLPIIISSRQNAIYIIPALPFFALGFSFFILYFSAHSLKIKLASYKFKRPLAIFSFTFLIGTLIYCFNLFGTPGREKDILSEISKFSKWIPRGESVLVGNNTNSDFSAHTYFQRFKEIEISNIPSKQHFMLIDKLKDSISGDLIKDLGKPKSIYQGKIYTVYKFE